MQLVLFLEHKDSMTKQLTIEDLCVTCPYGRASPALLGLCFVNSARPGHFCSNPTGQGRCDKALNEATRLNWRSYQYTPRPVQRAIYDYPTALVYVPLATKDHWNVQSVTLPAVPLECVRFIYAPLDSKGETWMVVNALTGQRKEVDMSQEHLCVDGSLLCYPYTGWDGAPVKLRCAACLYSGGCAVHGTGIAYPDTTLWESHETLRERQTGPITTAQLITETAKKRAR